MSASVLDAVATALRARNESPGEASDSFDVMTATGLPFSTVNEALAELQKAGRAVRVGPGTWLPTAASAGA